MRGNPILLAVVTALGLGLMAWAIAGLGRQPVPAETTKPQISPMETGFAMVSLQFDSTSPVERVRILSAEEVLLDTNPEKTSWISDFPIPDEEGGADWILEATWLEPDASKKALRVRDETTYDQTYWTEPGESRLEDILPSTAIGGAR